MDFDFIYIYTRKQAIEDGVLIDITDTAKGRGFIHSVAVTSTAWQTYIVPEDKLKFVGQSTQGRLWDLLGSLYSVIKTSPSTDFILFNTLFLMADDWHNYIRKYVGLKAVASVGDNGEPVITIMLPEED